MELKCPVQGNDATTETIEGRQCRLLVAYEPLKASSKFIFRNSFLPYHRCLMIDELYTAANCALVTDNDSEAFSR